ncbi:hypothetical protein AA0313_1835 [Acetobacter indonesiensis NRIC 0313]|nr:hypothetical protein AA0313_1835 [Acetobacter indonesiensis NRIC 0313]
MKWVNTCPAGATAPALKNVAEQRNKLGRAKGLVACFAVRAIHTNRFTTRQPTNKHTQKAANKRCDDQKKEAHRVCCAVGFVSLQASYLYRDQKKVCTV